MLNLPLAKRPEFISEKDWNTFCAGKTIHIGKLSVKTGVRVFRSYNWILFRPRWSPLWLRFEVPYPYDEGYLIGLQFIKYAPRKLMRNVKLDPILRCVRVTGPSGPYYP